MTPSSVPDDFGLQGEALRKKRDAGKHAAQAPQDRVAQVKVVTQRGTGERVIELDNGQVWVETVRNSGSALGAGDTVTIKPGRLGSYFLSTRSGFASRVMRVK